MNLFHIFMFIMFVIGLLLIITTFTAYSKLEDTCKSDGLRSKLRWAIGIGTTLVALSIGYTVCVVKDGRICNFGERANWKIYTMLSLLFCMGVGLLILTVGIKNDIKSEGCDIDLGSVPDILMVISIIQLIVPLLYMTYIIVKKSAQGSENEGVDVDDEDDDEEEDDDESLALEASSRREAIDKRRRSRYNKSIANYNEKLSSVLDKIELSKSRGKINRKDVSERDLLVSKIKKENTELSSIGSSSSETEKI
jgi:hypothetical protein